MDINKRMVIILINWMHIIFILIFCFFLLKIEVENFRMKKDDMLKP